MTLQQQYNLIKEGKGNKSQFLKHARSLFPEYFNQYTNYDNAVSVLKSKQIISEGVGGVVGKGFDIWDWKKILAEETKAVEKETSKEVLDNQKNAYNNSDMKNADNINFNEIMKGFYTEMKDPKNADKTGDELKAMVVKNLAKDPLYYTKNGELGTKGVGYTTEAPGLGEPKEPKGKYKSSGYGDLDTDKKIEKAKANVQDSLGDKEAKTSMPSKVKEMEVTPKSVSGVKRMPMPGAEKKIKLQENTDMLDQYLSIIDSNNMSEDEAYAYLEDQGLTPSQISSIINQAFPNSGMTEGEQKLRSLIRQVIKEEMEEAMYQGTSIKLGTGGSLGGRRFIPNTTVLSRDAVEAINAKGAKRLNWGKPHIKVVKSGDGVKLLISKPLIDTIVGSQRGRSKLSLSVSKMGTGITPEEMGELTGEFKKLVKVLNTSGKLTQNGDYYLLDVDTKYNEKSNQYEMPLPNQVTESVLRSLIHNIIKEELNEGSVEVNGKTVKTYTQNRDTSYNVTKDIIYVNNEGWDEINQLHRNAIGDDAYRKQFSEQFSKNQNDPSYIANYIAGGFADYIIPGSEKFTYGPDEEGTYHLEFQLEFDNLSYNTPEEEEEELQNQIGGSSGGGPGQAFSRTNVSYDGEKEGKYIFSVHQRGGYDI